MSTEYTSLREVALKCIDNVKFDGDASHVFETPRVQEALAEMMTLTIEALECISSYYSINKLSKRTFMMSMVFYSFEMQNVSPWMPTRW